MLRFCVLALILLLCAAPACAHPGRTDSQGGHYDHSTGKYHFHDGKYAGKSQSSSKSKSYSSYFNSATLEPKPTARPTIKAPAVRFNSNTSTKQTSKPTVTPSVAPTRTPKPTISKIFRTSPPAETAAAVINTVRPATNNSASNNFDLAAIIFPYALACIAGALWLTERRTSRNHLTRILSAEDEARDLKKKIESLTLVNRTLIAKNAKLTRDMQDISDLMTTVSALEHDVDQLSVECRRLKNANESFSVAYTGMTRRIQCLQEAASAGSPRHIIGHTGPMEAMVFIFGDHPSMFHTHIHGDWRNWRLIPLADAINKGYMPCKHCAILYNNALPDQSQYRLPRNT